MVEAAGVVSAQTQTETRFDCFLKAVLHKRIVPLLGAGVSFERIGQTSCLTQALRCRLRTDPVFGSDVMAAHVGELGQLAEYCRWRHGALELCKVLRIRCWRRIAPSRAHRYLALLAAEGLITDIVTTNYDCGLEIAWMEARGEGGQIFTFSI